jgi:RNA polymerase sigma factor (sigma-70 family)
MKLPLGQARMAESDLDKLLERSQKGDSAAWSALVQNFQGLVYSIPRRYRLNEEDASDVFMFTFQALYQNVDRLTSGRALPKWLATTATRETLKLIRLRSNHEADLPLEELIASEDADCEDEAIRSSEAMQVRAALKKLGGRCRDLLQLLYCDEEPAYVEIAAALKISVGAIGPTRSRCLGKLRKMLTEEDFFG